MSKTDWILDDVQRRVEYDGTSHADCVFINDLTLKIKREDYGIPSSVFESYEELFFADFTPVLKKLSSPDTWRDLVAYNYADADQPSRIVCAQFFPDSEGRINCTMTLLSCDMYGELPDDVYATECMLSRLCDESGFEPGDLTFNIGVAYTLYTDMEFVEADSFSWGD